MHRIPEYHSFKTWEIDGTVLVTVSIDRSIKMMPPIRMRPIAVAGLLEAFVAGDLRFMSFDEHPKRLTSMSVKSDGKPLVVRLTARSLVESDNFPSDWEIDDPRRFGGAPWNSQLK